MSDKSKGACEVPGSDKARDELHVKLEARVKKGLAILEIKDVAVAKAWIYVSKDAVIRYKQKCNVFFVMYSTFAPRRTDLRESRYKHESR